MTLHSVDRIIFIEDSFQALWVRKNIKFNEQTKLIALTAQAVLTLEEMGLPLTPISDIADMRFLASAERQYSIDCLNLLAEIESYILENYLLAQQVGQGFLTGQAYYVQISIGGIAARAFLMREAMRVFTPSSVVVFQGEIDDWFANDRYVNNPWIDTLYTICAESDIQVQLVSLPMPTTSSLTKKIKDSYLQTRSFAIQMAKDALACWKESSTRDGSNNEAFRLLFADAHGHDWLPVLDALEKSPDFSLFFLNKERFETSVWARCYAPVVHESYLRSVRKLGPAPIRFDNKERDNLLNILDRWILEHPQQAQLHVLGMNVFPSLIPHLRSVLSLSLPVAQYAKDLADKVLDIVQPHAICFFAMPWLSAKLLAFQAQQRAIPVISYQHGGSYGVQDVPTHDFGEYAYSDYFMSYGNGVLPPEDPVIPTHAQFVSVGSARIETLLKKDLGASKRQESFNILWVAEVSLRNTIGASWLVEDTTRYLSQKKCLEILGRAANINVVYRPFPSDLDAQATPNWIERAGLPSVSIDAYKSLSASILESDLVICDSSSGTTWYETLALRKPLIAYCDPRQTILRSHFAKDLEQACLWCKSVSELLDAVDRLSKGPEQFLAELRSRSPDNFLRKYVLHEGNCAEHVVSFLSAICNGKHHMQNMLNPNSNEPNWQELINGKS